MAAKKLDPKFLVKALDWAYSQALNGVGGIDSAAEIANHYRSQPGSLDEQARSLIRWQVAKAGTAGFVTGLGGALTLPVSVPASIASVLYVQVRMIAALAHLGGHDLNSDQVKTLCYACMCGNAAKDVVKGTGIQLGSQLTIQAIQRLSSEAIRSINRRVGFRLVTKFGGLGVINLSKLVPLAGGVIGAGFDSAATYAVGNLARTTFIAR